MDQAFEHITDFDQNYQDNQYNQDNQDNQIDQIDQNEQAILVDYIDPDDIEKERDELLFKCDNIQQECTTLSKKHHDLLKEHAGLLDTCDNQQDLIEKTEKLNIELNEKLKKEQKSNNDINKESHKKDILIELLNNKLINSQNAYDILKKQYSELSEDIIAKSLENDRYFDELKMEQQKRKIHLREIESTGNRYIMSNLEKDIDENRKKIKEYELEICTIKNQHKILLNQQYKKYEEYMKQQHDKHREDMKEQKRKTHLREIESLGSKYGINSLKKDIDENRKKIKEYESEIYTMRNQYKMNTEQQYDKYNQDAEQQYDKYKQDIEQQYNKYKMDLEQRQKIIDKLSTDYAAKIQELEKYRKMWEQSQETIKQYQSMSSQLQTVYTKSRESVRQYMSMYEELNKKYLEQTREHGRLQAKVTMYEYKPSQPQPYRPIQLNQVRPVQELRPLINASNKVSVDKLKQYGF
ncbi:MAG: hypothetical protein Terrestrivirus5_51 [Terrestrivirus sp.]|uniref:Uncharacterized protein n=1 Tax=Terrestrivirus sp. TaxID=2487775 RepID=A0A3G4ZS28_9VIRU|nr:MAG: hypothetical protein Terrestrivirus5_51 [Terrestrivirus sp.]